MTFPTIAVVIKMITAIWRGAMASRTIPFPLRMACGGAVSCGAIVSYATKLDGAGTVVQIVLIIAVAVLTCEILLVHMGLMRTRVWWVSMAVSTV